MRGQRPAKPPRTSVCHGQSPAAQPGVSVSPPVCFSERPANDALSTADFRSYFLDEHFTETGGYQNGIDVRGRTGRLEQELFMLHLAPVLQQHAEARRTKKRRLAKIHV